MSKPKNRIYCPDCGKEKMLFETEDKAKRFIKFNSVDITHGELLRPYFCIACGGYHISHKPNKINAQCRAERVINMYNDMKNARQKLINNKLAENNDNINQLVDLMKLELFTTRKDVNRFLNSIEIRNKFSAFVINHARLAYYQFNKLPSANKYRNY